MDIIRRLLAQLGNAGAVRNAEHAVLAIREEEAAFAPLLDRLALAA